MDANTITHPEFFFPKFPKMTYFRPLINLLAFLGVCGLVYLLGMDVFRLGLVTGVRSCQ